MVVNQIHKYWFVIRKRQCINVYKCFNYLLLSNTVNEMGNSVTSRYILNKLFVTRGNFYEETTFVCFFCSRLGSWCKCNFGAVLKSH